MPTYALRGLEADIRPKRAKFQAAGWRSMKACNERLEIRTSRGPNRFTANTEPPIHFQT